MQTCKNCGTVLDDDLRFCTECGTALRPVRYEPPTERMDIDPTLIIPPARVTDAPPPPSTPPPPRANSTQVVLKTAIATILLISFGSLITWLVIRDGRSADKITEMRADGGGSNQSNNSNSNSNSNESSVASAPTPYSNTNMAVNRNTTATAPTPYPTLTPTPTTAAPPTQKLAYLNKSDVRLRDRADIKATVVRENLTYGTRLVVLGTSSKVDNVWVQSENRYVRSSWMYVQLEDDPSIKGWVVSYVVSYR